MGGSIGRPLGAVSRASHFVGVGRRADVAGFRHVDRARRPRRAEWQHVWFGLGGPNRRLGCRAGV